MVSSTHRLACGRWSGLAPRDRRFAEMAGLRQLPPINLPATGNRRRHQRRRLRALNGRSAQCWKPKFRRGECMDRRGPTAPRHVSWDDPDCGGSRVLVARHAPARILMGSVWFKLWRAAAAWDDRAKSGGRCCGTMMVAPRDRTAQRRIRETLGCGSERSRPSSTH